MSDQLSRRWMVVVLAMAVAAGAAQAQSVVQVQDAWARATVPGQSASGAFMVLTAPQGATLEGVASPAATAELHEMVMQGDVMRMRALPRGFVCCACSAPRRPYRAKPCRRNA